MEFNLREIVLYHLQPRLAFGHKNQLTFFVFGNVAVFIFDKSIKFFFAFTTDPASFVDVYMVKTCLGIVLIKQTVLQYLKL